MVAGRGGSRPARVDPYYFPVPTSSALVNLRSRAVERVRRADPRVVAVLASVWLSVRGRQRCSVRHDDGLWIHRYRDGTLVGTRPGGPTPSQQDASVRDVFLYAYTPQPGDAVVDVGAGVGSEARLFSRLVGSEGRVLCVEADPTAARCLRRTVTENGLDNVTVVEAALSRARGLVRLELDAGSYLSNRLARGELDGIEVPAITFGDLLDELGMRSVALVKMNIEGAEGEVLVPAPPQLDRVDRLAVSCHDFRAHLPGCAWQATSTAVRTSLRDAGYELEARSKDSRPWIPWYVYASRN